MVFRAAIVSGLVAAVLGGAGAYYLAEDVKHDHIEYSREHAQDSKQNVVLLNPKITGYPPHGAGEVASGPTLSEFNFWLSYEKEIPLNSHSEFSLKLMSGYRHLFPAGASSLNIRASADIDIYGPRGRSAKNGGPYKIEYFIDSSYPEWSITWSVLPTKTGTKRIWLSDLQLYVGHARLMGIRSRDGFTKDNLIYDEKEGMIKGSAYIDVLVLRQDGISEKRYGQIQIVGTIFGILFGGGIISWAVQTLCKRKADAT